MFSLMPESLIGSSELFDNELLGSLPSLPDDPALMGIKEEDLDLELFDGGLGPEAMQQGGLFVQEVLPPPPQQQQPEAPKRTLLPHKVRLKPLDLFLFVLYEQKQHPGHLPTLKTIVREFLTICKSWEIVRGIVKRLAKSEKMGDVGDTMTRNEA